AGRPLDDKEVITASEHYPVFREAMGVIERDPVVDPLETGVKIIDLAIPVGKGQRELLIGDRQTGKSSIGIDAIINQRGKDVVCIYVCIGGSYTSLKRAVSLLAQKNALDYTVVVASTAAVSSAEQYLCPYSASAIGEYFMFHGRDVLVVFDDLIKHAWAYRQMSLLLERPPGREAYPGDIFYIHSQLMERAGKLKPEHGGGTMTFLPIVSTLQGDITGYVQSNLVSMTDGQIYLNASLFHEGFKPAIDMGLSVSRIGSKVQCPAVKKVSGGLRLEYAQYRELLRLTRLRTKLSDEAMRQMKRGEILRELLTQENGRPVSTIEEIVTFYALKSGALEKRGAQEVKAFKEGFFTYLTETDSELAGLLDSKRDLSDEIKTALDAEIEEFFSSLRDQENRG
ncbi:MAG: F0F1 ATP synthase subunit alpha, partial [Candidatus Omnitrophota bacterium]